MTKRLGLVGLCTLTGLGVLQAQVLPPLAVSDGQLPGERRAHALAVAGDLDGDGSEDYWVGSPFESTVALQAGAVRAISGKTGAVLRSWYGGAALDHFGWSLAGLGDVNGDGVPDVAVGSPDSDMQTLNGGLVQVISGQSGAVLFAVFGFNSGARLGYTVCALGDVNGDGRVDFAAGAPFDPSAGLDAGSVEIRSGLNGALLARHLGLNARDRLGIAVAAAGDLNADGRGDLLVGADQDGIGSGYVWLFSGPTSIKLFSLSGNDPGERFGAALAGGGELNGDGVPDFAVGASAGNWQGANCGSVRSYSGADGTRLFTVYGTAGGEAFGSALCFLPDLDGDARSELAVSALFENGAGGAAGVVRAISSSSQRPVRVWRGRSGGDRFGSALIAVGDRDGDNLADLIVGAPKDDGLSIDGGAALTHSTRDATAQGYCTGKLNSQGCVPHIVASGYASVSSAAQLDLRVQAVINNKVGILFFGRTRAAIPFQGGSLCIAPPIQRSSALYSGGNPGPGDCSGVLRFSVDPAWVMAHNWQAGERFDVQAWYRDPQHPDGSASGLSDALEFSLFN